MYALWQFPSRHLTLNRVLLLSHLLLVLGLVGSMSYARYTSEWRNKLESFVELSRQSFMPHLNDISRLVEEKDYPALTSPTILKHLNALTRLTFLDISSGAASQSAPVHIQFERASASLGVRDARDPARIQEPPWMMTTIENGFRLDKSTDSLHLVLPLNNSSHGRIWAVFNASRLMQFRQLLIRSLVIEAVSAVFFSMLVALYVIRRVVAPLKALANNMSAADYHRLELLPELTRQDEIGQLARAYRGLLENNQHQLRLLQVQNDTDTLTGIGSRHKYLRVAEDFIQRSLKQQRCVGMFVCDIDHFKAYNDDYGHKAGDKALVAVAKGIQQTLAPGDQLFRFGGEEFLVLLARPNKEGLRYAGETLRENIEQLCITHRSGSEKGVVTLSIGGAYACLKRMSLEALGAKAILEMLFEDADKSLYESKKQGRNRFVLSAQSIQ